MDTEDLDLIRKAFFLAREAHAGVKRKSGEPYILHPLAVARILVCEMGIQDPVSVVCALLHDVVEDTNIDLDEIERQFGKTSRYIIDGLTKISGSGMINQMDSRQAENFRKLLLTISDDIRVILIKLCDRLHNMRTLGSMRQDKMLKIASETLYIYAPLAHRLGLYEIKSELEDLSLKFSQPNVFNEIQAKIEANKVEAQKYIDRFVETVKVHLREAIDFDFTIKSRFKSVYSIYSKMQRKGVPFEEIYDLYAIRIILETRMGREREDCWYVYSVISRLYRPNPKRLRDWITVPKENSYEALHTTVLGLSGKWVEVQIRTRRMDDIAEKGIAAHWKYKENGQAEDFLLDWIGQVREILRNPNLNALEALREFKANLQPNDVFVFTPKGEMIRLPMRSGVLDFAYKIHSNIGDQAIGAKVNNQVVTLDYTLRPGDQVEILTSRKQRPQREWLRHVKTPRAKEHIKKALQRQRRDIIEQGRRLFLWRASQYNVDEKHPFMYELLAYFRYPTIDDFMYALGSHKIDTKRIAEFIMLKKEGKDLDKNFVSEWEHQRRAYANQWEDFGVDADMLVIGSDTNIDDYRLSKCCNPLPGDDIIAYDNDTHIVIHRTSCPKAISLMSSFGSRIIRAKWAEHDAGVTFLAAIRVVGLDKQGMLNDLIKVISLQMRLNIRKVTIESQGGMFEGDFKVYVRSSSELEELINQMEKLPHVFVAMRLDEEPEAILAPESDEK